MSLSVCYSHVSLHFICFFCLYISTGIVSVWSSVCYPFRFLHCLSFLSVAHFFPPLNLCGAILIPFPHLVFWQDACYLFLFLNCPYVFCRSPISFSPRENLGTRQKNSVERFNTVWLVPMFFSFTVHPPSVTYFFLFKLYINTLPFPVLGSVRSCSVIFHTAVVMWTCKFLTEHNDPVFSLLQLTCPCFTVMLFCHYTLESLWHHSVDLLSLQNHRAISSALSFMTASILFKL